MSKNFSSAALRIIVADDHEWIRQILMEVTRQTLPRAEVVEAADGVQALAAYRQGGCDFLVTNHYMPHMNGMSLTQHIRAQEPRLPIVMVSVHPEARKDAMDAGANWFLAKADIMEFLPALLLRHTRGGTESEPLG